MTKKILLTLFMVIALIIFFITKNPKKSKEKSPYSDQKNSSSYTASILDSQVEQINDFELSWVELDSSNSIMLHSNLEEKLTSQQAFEKYKCKFLVSSGFYTQEYQHIGLFKNHQGLLSPSKQSQIFNGYLNITKGNYFSISENFNKDLEVSLQSGPLLIVNDKYPKLSIKNDEYSRRIVALTTKDSNLVFMSIYRKGNIFSGPTLTDLQKILQKISDDNIIKINYALNLDGGTHSAFISKNLKLYEIAPIGGFFCLI